MAHLNRNLLVLFLAQLVFGTGSVLLVTVGGVVGSLLASDRSLATLPMSFFVVGTALTTIPSSHVNEANWPASRLRGQCSFGFGRRIYGGCCSKSGQFCALLLCGQPDRYDAGVRPAVSLCSYRECRNIWRGLRRCICAVRVDWWGFYWPGACGIGCDPGSAAAFKPAFQWVAGFYLLACLLLLGFRNTAPQAQEVSDAPERPLLQVVRQPLFIIAVLGGVMGQGVMTYLMTATPLSMHVIDGHSMADTGSVIRAHVIAMYLPSLITAPLIAMFGARKLMFVGILAMLLTLVCGLAGQAVMHYWWALVLLGVGWNFLFIGGTTLLVQNYSPAERFKAQAFNDFSIFGVSALASLLAGTLMFQLGWQVVLYSALPFLALMLLLLIWSLRVNPLQARGATES